MFAWRWGLEVRRAGVQGLARTAVHNCVGGSETSCLPPPGELAVMFADPSKAGLGYTVPPPSHWYKSQAEFL
eukprot:768129-Hanusia_phi.AAC.1